MRGTLTSKAPLILIYIPNINTLDAWDLNPKAPSIPYLTKY